MSNKGLTFLIIILLILCGATFGAFYLKTHPENPLSKKVFGNKVVPLVDENITKEPVPVDDNSYKVDPIPTPPPVTPPVTPPVVVTPTPPPVTPPVVVTPPPVVTPPVTNAPQIKLVLKKGSKGPEVKILQQFLIDNAYLEGKADGVFGPMTEGAVKKFQTEYKLTTDGIVDGKTRTTINELLAA